MIIISRIVTALILGLVGYQIGRSANIEDRLPDYATIMVRYGGLILVGAVTGFIVGGLLGKLVRRGVDNINEALKSRSGGELIVGAIGLIIGLLVAFLANLPLGGLEFVGNYLRLPLTLIIAYLFAEIAAMKHVEILRMVGVRVDRSDAQGKLLDSSTLIDGRIADIVSAGFVEGELVVPVFVLEELQLVADSTDELRRARGRRGLDVVHRLRKARRVRTPSDDWPEITGVDSKLIRMAREQDCAIVTTDFNLGKVAHALQVRVLNVNQLAQAMKPQFIAGERFDVRIVKEGKESGQGVGYLDDGTMVIVDGGAEVLGQTVAVVVTSVIQTASGKLVFSRLAEVPAT